MNLTKYEANLERLIDRLEVARAGVEARPTWRGQGTDPKI